MDKITFDITESLGIISSQNSGWNTELNMVSWNGKEPKYDIRSWDVNHEKMSKGITLTKNEILKLKEILGSIN